MITKRIIPCLDVRNGRVVKGVNFEGVRDVSSPVELARYYSDCGADELVFYDITASYEGRALFTDILTDVASQIFIPLTVGGGINTLEDFDRVLKCGADKVSVNSGAIRNPELIREAARRYGDQCVVLSADIKRVDGSFRVFAKGGREDTGIEAISWIKRCVSMGAGEIVVNSIDTDGVKLKNLRKSFHHIIVEIIDSLNNLLESLLQAVNLGERCNLTIALPWAHEEVVLATVGEEDIVHIVDIRILLGRIVRGLDERTRRRHGGEIHGGTQTPTFRVVNKSERVHTQNQNYGREESALKGCSSAFYKKRRNCVL